VIARTVPITVICAWAYKKAPEAIRPGVWIPISNLAFDLFENLLIFLLIKIFPQRVEAIEYLTIFVIQLKWFTFKVSLALIFVSMLVGIYYTFHSLLADSLMLEKDRQQKLKAREQVQDVLQRSAARRAAAASTSRSNAVDKKNT
jgi:predicted membrane protein